MALNFTPLDAYAVDVLSGAKLAAENRANAARGIGAIAGLVANETYKRKARDFFAQFEDDGEIARIDAMIAENNAKIEELEKELSAMEVTDGIE